MKNIILKKTCSKSHLSIMYQKFTYFMKKHNLFPDQQQSSFSFVELLKKEDGI